jgi:DNA polymerase-3 subunit beta
VKATADRTSLCDAVTWVSRAIGKDSSLPILMAIKIEADEGELRLSAFDYEISLSARVDAEVGEPGVALVSGRALAAYLGATRSDDVSVHVEGSHLVVVAGQSRSEFPVIGDFIDYPQLPAISGDPTGRLDASVLTNLVGRLAPITAPSSQIFDPWSTGIHLVSIDGHLVAEAGTRVVLGQLVYGVPMGELDLLVPAYGLGNAVKGLSGDLAVHTDGNILGLVGSNRSVTLRLLDGKFPKVADGMAQVGPSHLTVDRDELLAALRSVSTSSNRVLLKVEPSVLTLVTFDPEKGERRSTVTETLPVESDDSGEIRAAIDYLTNCLQGVNEGAVSIDCNLSETKPAILSDGVARFVFMTLRGNK